MQKLVIVGISSTAKMILAFINKYHLYEVIGFAVDKQYIQESTYCALPVYAIEDLDDIFDRENDFLFVAIQWNRLNADRREIFERLKVKGFQFANLISPMAVINGVIKGENCWIADMVIVDFGATIGSDVFIKVSAWVGPNTIISDHCFISAKSAIAGGCFIGEQSFIGINATIFDCTQIGKKCIVGACTSIKRNMSNFSKSKTLSTSVDFIQYEEYEVENKLLFSKNVRK